MPITNNGGEKMKIALTSYKGTIDDTLDLRFGRSSYFVIYDLNSGEYKSVNNKGESSSGGAGIAAAQQLIDEGVESVITGNVGPNAYELLKASEIKVYKGDKLPLNTLIDKYKNGELEEIKEPGPKHKGGF